jgi:hypothetical protein
MFISSTETHVSRAKTAGKLAGAWRRAGSKRGSIAAAQMAQPTDDNQILRLPKHAP